MVVSLRGQQEDLRQSNLNSSLHRDRAAAEDSPSSLVMFRMLCKEIRPVGLKERKQSWVLPSPGSIGGFTLV